MVISARTGDELLTLATQQPIDAAILDVRMPPSFTDEGLRIAEQLAASHPAVGILMLSAHDEIAYATRLFAAGTGHRGYLLKDRVDNAAALRDALERVCRGEGGGRRHADRAAPRPPAAPEPAERPDRA